MGVYVISLGGSLLVPGKIDVAYLRKVVALLSLVAKKHRLVVVCGGGAPARLYIDALAKLGCPVEMQNWIGIKTTKINATLVNSLLGNLEPLPDSLQEVKFMLSSRKIIVCGALGFQPNMTSDGTAAQVAAYVGADAFFNLTNVKGLFDKDPKFKTAKFIEHISFSNFSSMVKKIGYTPGQHFVLDGYAAKIIAEQKIRTVILDGKKIKNLEAALLGKEFVGTTIDG